ncbi:MAG: universal stress protein [Cyclobacteriaceae bacterium]|nr:MAG: universal stress protein [Cyclobacteriaceae bacterium]
MSYKKILVPVDFSDCAVNALKYAISFAKSTEAKLVLLHAYHLPIPVAEAGLNINTNIAEEYISEGTEKMKQLYSRFPELEQLSEPYEIKMSFASDAIVTTAKELKAELIIMGTHGATNVFDELVGSNTLHVIKKSNIPVLAIPINYEQNNVKNILFSYDYQSIKSKQVIQPLIDFALAFAAKVHIMHITDNLAKLHAGAVGEAKLLEGYLKGISHTYHMAEGEHVEGSILEYIKSHPIDIIAVMPRKHTLFERIFQSSVTKQLVHRSNIPLFAFPEGS